MRFQLALIALFGLFIEFSAHADALWQNTEYGMTPAQVLEVYPEAFRPDDPGHLTNGATELLRLPPIELVGQQFTPHFYFEDEKLLQVTLDLASLRDSSDARAVLRRLVEALTAKYGKELNKDEGDNEMMARYRATWMSGRTNITLLYIKIGKNDPLLNVVYQVRLASEFDNL